MIASPHIDFTATFQDTRALVFPELMGPLLPIVDFLLFLSLFAAVKAFRDHRRRGGLPYPPGPRPVPLIGNLLDIPRESSWIAYTELAKKYGASHAFSPSRGSVICETRRRRHVFPRPGPSRRHFGLHQGHEKSAREARAHLL